ARRFEHEADQLVGAARDEARRRPDRAVFRDLLEVSDDAADHLEDVTFLLDLLSQADGADAGAETLAALRDLTGIAVEATREWIRALSHSMAVSNASPREDSDDFLAAIDRVAALEHNADDTERALTRLAIQHARDFRQLHLYTAISDRLEESVDALK